MSIGNGIVIAALILVTVWQIDKHARWPHLRLVLLAPIQVIARGIAGAKLAVRRNRWLVAGVLILAGTVLLSLAIIEDRKGSAAMADQQSRIRAADALNQEQAQAEANAILAGEYRTYGGFTLGELRQVVRFKHGMGIEERQSVATYQAVRFGGRLTLWFDQEGRVGVISCRQDPEPNYIFSRNACPPIAGLFRPLLAPDFREDDAALRAYLAKPAHLTGINADGIQRWCYGSPTSWVCFLRRADVFEGVEVGDRDDYGSASEYW